MADMCYDPMDYHIDAITKKLVDQHPDMESLRQQTRDKVMQAINSVKGGQRQNKSSADKYPTPPVKVVSNPTGAFAGKKGK